MSPEKINIIALIIFVSIFCTFSVFLEKNDLKNDKIELQKQSRVIENAIWDYDPKGPVEYLKLAAIYRNYEHITVFAVNNEVFLEIDGPEVSVFSQLLIKIGLIPKRKLEADIFHHDQIVGRIEVIHRHDTIYAHTYSFIILGFVLLVSRFFVRIKERTKELRDAQEELLRKERLALLGHFAGSISHELRNPLGVIDSSAYYLKMKLGDSNEKVAQHLERIKSSVHSATAIIQSLLNLTRMKKPDAEQHDMIAVVLESLEGSNIPNTVAVERHFPDQEIPVKVEHEQIRIAPKNIIKNAVEAMNGTGTLSVTTRKTEKGQAELIFKDTGAGIKSKHLEKVFQPLFSTRVQGIGFGLSITHMIIENHGGTIAAKSESGKGAAFIITLPLVAERDQENE